MIAYIRPAQMSCPDCRTILKRGRPRFGPEIIKCRNCGREIRTGLTGWSHLSPAEKVFIGISEIIAPSRFGPVLYSLIFEFLIGFLLCIPIGCLLVSIHDPLTALVSQNFATFIEFSLVGLLLLIIIAALTARLIRLVKESNEFSKTNIPPEWKAGVW